ncbi:MAG TPA: Dabb family protein [Thermopolyspora sp.]|jgi:Stress responsive A/B Barrel Domain.
MFRHVVMFKWTPEATEEQKATVAAELRKLPDAISEIRRYDFGADAGISPGNYEFVVVADFDDVDGYLVYRDHPVHRKVIDDHISSIVAVRSAVQYRI